MHFKGLFFYKESKNDFDIKTTIMKTFIFSWAFISIIGLVIGQNDSLFHEVNQAQQGRIKFSFTDSRDSAFSVFDQKITALIQSTNLCDDLPDSTYDYFIVNKLDNEHVGQTLAYALMNNIVVCSDSSLSVYSWDNLDGGSAHSYSSFLVYKNEKNNCLSFSLDTNYSELEVGYYKIESFVENKNHYHLLFGYGTYGMGNQHFVVRMFEEKNGEMIECINCFAEENSLLIGANRNQEINLIYKPKNLIITYKYYIFDEEYLSYRKSFEEVNLKFVNGKWTKIQ